MDLKSGTELIAAERTQQVQAKGWTAEHDDAHDYGQLIAAAMCYASVPLLRMTYKGPAAGAEITEVMATKWPWDEEWWRPSNDAVRNLVKAGALIAAEIDRLQREVQRTAKCDEETAREQQEMRDGMLRG